MPSATISATYPILCRNDAALHRMSVPLTLVLPRASGPLSVTIFGDERFATVERKSVEVSEALLTWLRSSPGLINGYPKLLEQELLEYEELLEDAARTVLGAVKYLMSRPEMLDNSIGLASEFKCVTDAGEQLQVPVPIRGSSSGYTALALNGVAVDELQAGLNDGRLPLSGMRHLHRAMQESEPRFRWIDATIALELCIKEALIRKRPDFKTLLMDMPSPPLDKLYGDLMEEVLGEPSPFKKDIKKGAEFRNKLVHRPMDVIVTREEASKYVSTAHKAIHHLFRRLYPDWLISEHMTEMVFHD